MGLLLRYRAMAALLACSIVPIASGCGGNPNEAQDADAKVVIPANAPKTQEEFYKQQQALSKANKVRRGSR